MNVSEQEKAQPVIVVDHVSKTFHTQDGDKNALEDVSLTIREGEIYGLIGLSGAGKSTLIRLFNGIETPTEGEVTVLGQRLKDLSNKELRALRTKIGMIFQQFNLMPSRTAYDNVLFPLKNSGLSKEERERKADELLELVGLADKKDQYPSELSGGQQQRVAIARALVNEPRILLCDEATSALDPTTTKSILHLLRQVNHDLGVTVVIVTHQMSVVKEVCDRVAVLETGRVVESGPVFNVFADPKAELTRSFISTTSNLGGIGALLEGPDPVISLRPGQRLIKMRYQSRDVSEPLVSVISQRFGVSVNIFLSDVEIIGRAPIGGIIGVFEGPGNSIDEAIDYLKGKNIEVEVLK